MKAARSLLENYWIPKEQDRELYHNTKKELSSCRRFFTEQLGWSLISNERILKAEKIPAHAESFMGITEFDETRDYCFFCALLIFLEDKEDGEQFLLSELVAMVEAQLQDNMEIDWTMFTQRKSLVRALKFAEQRGLLKVYDGSSDKVSSGIEHEVLYENTGLSRYFVVNFGHSISDMTSYRDFENGHQEELETDRGHFRIHRVYRQLAAAPAMYWASVEDQDSVYLKNQRQWVGKYLDEQLGGRLDIHKNAAFFVLDEDDCFGEYHPREATISEVTLNICYELRELITDQSIIRENDDRIFMTRTAFQKILTDCQKNYGAAWSKEFRTMPIERLERVMLEHMQAWMLVQIDEDKIILRPAVGKLTGIYPEEFLQREAAKHE